MEIPEGLSVCDEFGTEYTRSSDVVVSADNYVIFRADSKLRIYWVKLFSCGSEREREEFCERVRQNAMTYKDIMPEIRLLEKPVMGYVIASGMSKQLLLSEIGNVRVKYVVDILRLIADAADQLTKRGACLCGAYDEAFLCRPDIVQICAPECIYPIGDFTANKGRLLRRAPECCRGLRICTSQEFVYCFALIVSRMYFRTDAFDRAETAKQLCKIRKAEKKKAEEMEEFEFGFWDDGDEDEPTAEDDEENDDISDEEYEEYILSGKIHNVFYRTSGSYRRAPVSAHHSYTLERLTDAALSTNAGTEKRPTWQEWIDSLKEVHRDSYYCSCGRRYSLDRLFHIPCEDRICAVPKCGTEIPGIIQIVFYNLSRDCMELISREVDVANMFTPEERYSIFLNKLYSVCCVDGVSKDVVIMMDEFYQEKCFEGRTLMVFSSNGSGGIKVVFPEVGEMMKVTCLYDGTVVNGENTDQGESYTFDEPKWAEIRLAAADPSAPGGKERCRVMVIRFYDSAEEDGQ